MNGRLQRGVIIIPNAFTLGNLFFGIWAIVSAARGNFTHAAWLIVLAGIADMFDGRVARVTKTGSKFGEELDSLVDGISFGVAPALIIFHLFLQDGHWGWVAVWIYVSGAVVRLARFNVEQAGHAKAAFHGLPSPSAGMTLATFYPFSQTAFFQSYLTGLPWRDLVIALMVILSVLMMSHVLYPVVPKFGFKSVKGIATLVFFTGAFIAAITIPALFFFPFFFTYVSFGLIRAVLLGLFERLDDSKDPLLDVEEGDEAGAEVREIDYEEIQPRRGRRRRRGRGHRAAPDPRTIHFPGHSPEDRK